MTTARRRSLTLLACLPALIAGAGCDDDDSSDASAPAPAIAQPATTPERASEPEITIPAAGDVRLTDAQRKGLLTANNTIALEEDSADFSTTGPLYAANYRAVAEPLADGPCKEALEAAAANWTALGKADAAEDAAEKQRLGEMMPELSGDADRACT